MSNWFTRVKKPTPRASLADVLALEGVSATLTPPRSVKGRIMLVGAGPGDPELLTVKAVHALEQADVIIYDGLVDPRILDIANWRAERISVAKSRSQHTLSQDKINALLVAKASGGLLVVRLKGGDPFIFGRGGEEVDAARAAGIPVEVVPGVTAALGCAAESLVPLTHRHYASAVTFVAGQCKDLTEQNWKGLAGPGRTLAIYMGLASAPLIMQKLLEDGLPADTPAAILEGGTRPTARTFKTTLSALPEVVSREAIESPALLIIGDVAALAVENPGFLDPLQQDIWALALAAE